MARYRRAQPPRPLCAVYKLNTEQPHELLFMGTSYADASSVMLQLRQDGTPHAMVDPCHDYLRIGVHIPFPRIPTPVDIAVSVCISEELKQPEPKIVPPPPTLTGPEVDELAATLFGGADSSHRLCWM